MPVRSTAIIEHFSALTRALRFTIPQAVFHYVMRCGKGLRRSATTPQGNVRVFVRHGKCVVEFADHGQGPAFEARIAAHSRQARGPPRRHRSSAAPLCTRVRRRAPRPLALADEHSAADCRVANRAGRASSGRSSGNLGEAHHGKQRDQRQSRSASDGARRHGPVPIFAQPALSRANSPLRGPRLHREHPMAVRLAGASLGHRSLRSDPPRRRLPHREVRCRVRELPTTRTALAVMHQ